MSLTSQKPEDRLERLENALTARGRLSDAQWLTLTRDHRWAVGELTRESLSQERRARLNRAVLSMHTRLHAASQRGSKNRLRRGLLRVSRPFFGCWILFLGAALLAAAAVAAEPTVVYFLVPRDLLGQIADNAWGERSGAGADVGMTLFYSANNSRACLLALGLGVLGGVPGLLVIAFNGALLGAVAGHALHSGVFMNLMRWLGPHGVPELSAIMLSGAIGWALGMAWIQPGPRPRKQALSHRAEELTPMIGVAVALVLAAAPFEGFISPMPLPLSVDLTIAALWVALLVFGARRILKSGAPSL
ncbi:MAG: stage II sporulation protein M [Myxococcota bacterium]